MTLEYQETLEDSGMYNKAQCLRNIGSDYDIDKRFVKTPNLMSVQLEAEHKNDKVNHPSHYTWLKEKCGIEVIDIARHLNFNRGNALKYLLRSGHKSEEGYSNSEKEIEDLEKAIWCLKDEILRLKNYK